MCTKSLIGELVNNIVLFGQKKEFRYSEFSPLLLGDTYHKPCHPFVKSKVSKQGMTEEGSFYTYIMPS